jgi:hypothetical protein
MHAERKSLQTLNLMDAEALKNRLLSWKCLQKLCFNRFLPHYHSASEVYPSKGPGYTEMMKRSWWYWADNLGIFYFMKDCEIKTLVLKKLFHFNSEHAKISRGTAINKIILDT